MKKALTLLLAAGLALGAASESHAIDFKVKGSWQLAFDYIDGGAFMSKTRAGKNVTGQQWAAVRQQRDNFEAIQRLHLQIQAVASESLSGTVFFEIGEQRWGMGAQGGALGADGIMVKLKQAFIDWTVPNTDLKLRMGIQGVKLPGFAVDSPVFQDDVAGITATYKFNSMASATAMWMRPLNDNWAGNDNAPSNYMDNMDLFALLVPLTFDGVKVTPWGMGGSMGPNTIRHSTSDVTGNTFRFANHNALGQAIDGWQIQDGLYPAAVSTRRSPTKLFPHEYNSMFWGGITAEITAAEPWRFMIDLVYGGVDNGRDYLNRAGWYGMAVAEYKLDWGTPGLYGWYFSGDDDDPSNGSERLPYIATTNNLTNSLSTFGYRGNPIMGGGKGVLGTNPSGTWGIGARIKDISFLEDLKHTLRVNFFGGTNAEGMAGYITGRKTMDGSRTVYRNNRSPNPDFPTDFNSFGTYLTTADTGIEVNFDNTWKPYDNLSIVVETGYIHLWLDDGVWGKYGNIAGDSLDYKDAWKASVNFIYSF